MLLYSITVLKKSAITISLFSVDGPSCSSCTRSYFAAYSGLPLENSFAFHAVGTFNQTQATEYCLTVKDVVLLDFHFSEENME